MYIPYWISLLLLSTTTEIGFCQKDAKLGEKGPGHGKDVKTRQKRAASHGYLGCFVDDRARILRDKFFRSTSMTVEKCINSCTKGGFMYAGLEFSQYCCCGNNMYKKIRRSNADCRNSCAGNHRQKCGGSWRISVYKNPNAHPINKHPGYLGCFVDIHTRILRGKFIQSKSMTVEKCIVACTKYGFLYTGLEDNHQCFCGNNMLKKIRKSNTECGFKCSGNNKEMCGGWWRISVYKNRVKHLPNADKTKHPFAYCRSDHDCHHYGKCFRNKCRCIKGYFGDGVHSCSKTCECSASGDPHYRTYDHQLITFQGICKYTLTKSTTTNDKCAFNIEVKNEHRGKKTSVSYTRLVDVKIDGDTIRLHQKKKTLVNGKLVFLPYHGKGYKIFISGYNVRLESKCNVNVEWNGNHVVSVSVPRKYANKMTGICGDCNGKKDDIKTKDGTDVSKKKNGLQLMLESYRVKDDSDKPHKHCKAPEPKPPCTRIQHQRAAHPHVCGYINPDLWAHSPFRNCLRRQRPLATQMYTDCVYDYCFYTKNPVNIQEVICDSLAAFAEQCELRGFPAKWRTPHFCPLKCEENMRFSSFVSGCPATCTNLKSEKHCKLPASEGCECIPGFVLSNNKCVPKSRCGCKGKRGHYYPVGAQKTSADCSTTIKCARVHGVPKIVTVKRNIHCPAHSKCVLSKGRYMCLCPKGFEFDGTTCTQTSQVPHGQCETSSDCDANGVCYRKACRCKKGYVGDGFNVCTRSCVCVASGDPHYLTYDHQLINFQGICKYTMTKSTTKHDPCAFNVEVKNEHRGRNWRVAYTRLVDVKIYGDTIRLHQKGITYVNGKKVFLPYHSHDYKIFRSGKHVRIETKCLIYFDWDGNYVIAVAVPKTYANKMTGICGECNGKKDDYKTKQGVDVSRKRNRFFLIGNSYNVLDDSDKRHKHCISKEPTDHCTHKLRLRADRPDVCGYLDPAMKYHTPFLKCIQKHHTLAKKMFASCVYDFCVYSKKTAYIAKSICHSVEGFAEQCKLRGLPAKWRTKTFCPMKCGPHMKYSSSVSGCPATCINPHSEKHCKVPPAEGCRCNVGLVLSDKKCVHRSHCGCKSRRGNYYPIGHMMTSRDCSVTVKCARVKGRPKLVVVKRSRKCPRKSKCVVSHGTPRCRCMLGYRYDGHKCKRIGHLIACPGYNAHQNHG